MNRNRLFAVAVGTLLATATLTLPTVGAFHSSAPVLLEDSGDGNTGWGIEVTHETVGDIEIDVEGTGPVSSSEVSLGATFFDDGEPIFMIAVTQHVSPHRMTGVVGPVEIDPEPTVVTSGDADELPYDVSVDAQTHTTSAGCPFICLALNSEGAEPGDHHWVAWMGGLSSTELLVRSTAEATADANQGPAHVLGDPELEGGTVNTQVQRGVANGQAVGLKAMVDVPYETTVDSELFGFWARSTVKVACAASLPCLTPETLHPVCTEFVRELGIEATCSTASLGWKGPEAAGGTGGSFYSFMGAPSGDYAFIVERKVDAYGPLVFQPDLGTLVWLGEDHSFLTVTDVAVP